MRALCRERGRGKVVMQKIADWLGQLGLSEYARRFADNAIDLSVIGDLTEQDLKDLGVLLGIAATSTRNRAARGSLSVSAQMKSPATMGGAKVVHSILR